MIESLRNWSSPSRIIYLGHSKNTLAILFVLIRLLIFSQLNHVGNPSFENILSCSMPNFISKSAYWNSIDSAKFICGGTCYHTCFSNVPYNVAFQYPRTGNGYSRVTFFCLPSCRTYPKNRLVSTLTAGKTYCVKMYLNLQNNSPNALDAFGIYLGDSSVDTISSCSIPLTFLSPQVQNPSLSFITDTLGWTEVKGTFVAMGTEKYLVVGNFKSDAATVLNPTGVGSGSWSEYFIDDVSVIDYNLPAYAGPDKNIVLGDSAFIGRPPEIGLECTWTTGTTTVGTGGGIWVKPPSSGTYSYVVTQDICGNIKTDTVFVSTSVGLKSENEVFAESISVFPNPAKDVVNISLQHYYESTISAVIYDVNGRAVLNKELVVANSKASLQTSELANGVYILRIRNSLDQVAIKRLVITR